MLFPPNLVEIDKKLMAYSLSDFGQYGESLTRFYDKCTKLEHFFIEKINSKKFKLIFAR